MKNSTRMRLLLIVALSLLNLTSPASAQQSPQKIVVQQVLGDGKGGRVWNEWHGKIEEAPVESVSVVLRRESGGSDTYVNLRYEGAPSFEFGKRVYLADGNSTTVTWNLKGEAPRKRALVMNAYSGEVFIDFVEVYYRGRSRAASSNQAGSASPQNPAISSHDAEVAKRCRWARVRPPQIDIGLFRPTGSLFSGKFKAEGSIYGNCVEEVGYFEGGRLKRKIEFPYSDRYQRKNFSVTVRTGRGGEFRVLTGDGKEDRIGVDETIAKQGQALF